MRSSYEWRDSRRMICRWNATNIVSSFVLLGSLLVVGCSEPGAKTVIGESSFDSGLQAFEEKDYSEAVILLSRALENGSLNADLMCDARLMRAKARIELSEYDEAQEDLDFLMEGAHDIASVLATKGLLALKQGQKEQATRYYQEARKMNSKIVLPPELR